MTLEKTYKEYKRDLPKRPLLERYTDFESNDEKESVEGVHELKTKEEEFEKKEQRRGNKQNRRLERYGGRGGLRGEPQLA